MTISIWFVRRDSGNRDESMPEQIVETIDQAIDMVRAHKHGLHGNEHIVRVSASAGEISPEDQQRLVEAGGEVL